MFGYSQSPKSWCLTRGMARLCGVNLPMAVLDGWLTRAELEDLVERCDHCKAFAECSLWMAQSGAATAMPGFCPNKSRIEALAVPN
ncbi:MAG: DUF6455 family protein [Paracoccaceae bacterium]